MSKIDKLIKARQDEAAEKKISAKARCVVKFSGRKIISQGEYTLEQWELMNQEIFDSEESSRQIGCLFQGYAWGENFEIQHLTDQEILTILYNSDTVYQESSGVVSIFAPGEWEHFLNKMYDMSLTREEKYAKIQEESHALKINQKLEQYMDYLRKNWGLSF